MAMQPISLDYLNVGSEVLIKTSLNQEVTGQVISCEGASRLLLLRSHRAGQAENCDDLHMINMDHVVDVRVLKDNIDNLDGNRGAQPNQGSDLAYVDIAQIGDVLKQRSAALSQERSQLTKPVIATQAAISGGNASQSKKVSSK